MSNNANDKKKELNRIHKEHQRIHKNIASLVNNEYHRAHKSIKTNDKNKEHNRIQKNNKSKGEHNRTYQNDTCCDENEELNNEHKEHKRIYKEQQRVHKSIALPEMDEQHRVKHKSIKPNDGNKEHNRTQKNTKAKEEHKEHNRIKEEHKEHYRIQKNTKAKEEHRKHNYRIQKNTKATEEHKEHNRIYQNDTCCDENEELNNDEHKEHKRIYKEHQRAHKSIALLEIDEQHRIHKSIKPNDENKEHNRTQKNTKAKEEHKEHNRIKEEHKEHNRIQKKTKAKEEHKEHNRIYRNDTCCDDNEELSNDKHKEHKRIHKNAVSCDKNIEISRLSKNTKSSDENNEHNRTRVNTKDYNIESIKIIKEKEYIHKEAQKNKKLFDSKDTIRINLLNIQGLSQVKAVELEEMMKTNELLCLTETQQKIEKTKLKKSTKYLTTMRTQEEKKGGGLMIMHKSNNITIEKCSATNNNLMITKCKAYGETFKLILVYMSVDDTNQNKEIMEEIEKAIENTKEDFIIMGDFNGHVGFLGNHPMNKNGELLCNLIDKHTLVLLNGHPECEGEITWEQRGRKSVIDYILVNKNMHEKFISMVIDENREFCDLSDHNLMTAVFQGSKRCGKTFVRKHSSESTYMKINDETKAAFMDTVRNNINIDTSIGEYERVICNAKEKCLMKTIKRKVSSQDNNKEENAWFNKEIENAIKLRKSYNRQKRNENNEFKKMFYVIFIMNKRKEYNPSSEMPLPNMR